MDMRPEAVSEDADKFDDHLVRELFALSLGLQGLVQLQARHENRIRLAGYVDRLDSLIRHIRAGGADDCSGDAGEAPETLPQRLLRTAEDESVVLGLPVHVEFRGRLDFSTELSDRVVLVVRDALHNIACHANASSARLRVSVVDGLVTVEIIDDGRDPDSAARITALAGHRGALRQTTTDAGGTHLTWTARVR
jgi:signal transduction histidine kinase